MKVYVASSWRNQEYPRVLALLRGAGHECYDFRDPEFGFNWAKVDPEFTRRMTAVRFRDSLRGSRQQQAFKNDFNAMQAVEALVLVGPCGRSAHLELGWAIGAGKRTAIYLPTAMEPELMYLMADYLCVNDHELLEALR